MSQQVRSNIPDLYSRLFDNVQARVEPTVDKIFEQLTTVMTDDSKQVDVSEASGSGMWTLTEEGGATEQQEIIQGYDKTFLHAKYGAKLSLSLEAVEDDEHAIVDFLLKYETMIRGGYARANQLVADLYSDAFSTAGPDGQYLISAAHPLNASSSSNLSNLLSGALSHDNLETAEKTISDNYYGEDGIPIQEYGTRKLIFPPALRGIVMRIMESRNRPTTTDRDINRFGPEINKNRFNVILSYDPIEFKYLQNAQGGSDTAWYIRMPNQKMLRFYWRKKPYYDKWMENDPEAILVKSSMRCSTGPTNFREIFGSTGT